MELVVGCEWDRLERRPESNVGSQLLCVSINVQTLKWYVVEFRCSQWMPDGSLGGTIDVVGIIEELKPVNIVPTRNIGWARHGG